MGKEEKTKLRVVIFGLVADAIITGGSELSFGSKRIGVRTFSKHKGCRLERGYREGV